MSYSFGRGVLCREGGADDEGGASRDDESEGTQDTNVEEGPGYGVSQHATHLPPGMRPDDLLWMAQYVAFTSQALCYAEQVCVCVGAEGGGEGQWASSW